MSIIKNTKLSAAISSIVIVLGLGTWLFHWLEDWTWLESLYFVVSTATTVGYGDVTPETDMGRIAAIVFMLIGTGILVTSIGFIGAYFVNRREAKIKKNRS